MTPGGALAAVLFGSILRAILEYALPKDGLLAIPHGEFNFDYGAGQVCKNMSNITELNGWGCCGTSVPEPCFKVTGNRRCRPRAVQVCLRVPIVVVETRLWSREILPNGQHLGYYFVRDAHSTIQCGPLSLSRKDDAKYVVPWLCEYILELPSPRVSLRPDSAARCSNDRYLWRA